MNKKKILIAGIVLLVVIITFCLIKIVFNNSHIETASINTLAIRGFALVEMPTSWSPMSGLLSTES